ncbi:MAG: 1-aminocyclopropane-1-carboxylate deaminase/D-cysteine desulfhydrase [Flavobacteriales bacterium]
MDLQLSDWFAKLKSHSQLESFAFQNSNNSLAQLFVKRDDLIHNEISGNKIRKLEGNLLAANKLGANQLMTFGGAFSNHLLASAAAAKAIGMPIIGKVRGEELTEQSNSLLKRCAELGMQLQFLSRSQFAQEKHKQGLHDIQNLPTWIIPEGGANPEGIWACSQIYPEAVSQNNNQHFDAVFIAQGTTTTSLGILASIPPTTQLFVVPVLKGFDSLAEMQALATMAQNNPFTANFQFNWQQVTVLDTYHHGGYAKTTPELLNFINAFSSLNQFNDANQLNSVNQFLIEPTYTAKALFALHDLLLKADPRLLPPTIPTPEPKRILFVHTGGIHARN